MCSRSIFVSVVVMTMVACGETKSDDSKTDAAQPTMDDVQFQAAPPNDPACQNAPNAKSQQVEGVDALARLVAKKSNHRFVMCGEPTVIAAKTENGITTGSTVYSAVVVPNEPGADPLGLDLAEMSCNWSCTGNECNAHGCSKGNGASCTPCTCRCSAPGCGECSECTCDRNMVYRYN